MFKLYAENKEEKFIYEVTFSKTIIEGGLFYQQWNLNLVCGVDYINENSDIQGWVQADRFTEDVQFESYIVYWDESVKSRLENEGYIIRRELPKIY